jgi:hypothetical protein
MTAHRCVRHCFATLKQGETIRLPIGAYPTAAPIATMRFMVQHIFEPADGSVPRVIEEIGPKVPAELLKRPIEYLTDSSSPGVHTFVVLDWNMADPTNGEGSPVRSYDFHVI